MAAQQRTMNKACFAGHHCAFLPNPITMLRSAYFLIETRRRCLGRIGIGYPEKQELEGVILENLPAGIDQVAMQRPDQLQAR